MMSMTRRQSHDAGVRAVPHGAEARWSPIMLVGALSGLVDPLIGLYAEITSIFWNPKLPSRADTPRRRSRGLTLVLGGIEGPSPYNRAMACAVLESGYRGAVRRIDWNGGLPLIRSLINLMSKRHQKRWAAEVARQIIEQKRAHPDAPVCLLSQSGGTFIVVKALELLPEDVKACTAVLLAPSISPAYDISIAASKCSDGLVSVGGPGDYMFLGIGTSLLGSSDRVFGPAAGWVGWHHHGRPDFIELRWHPSWLAHGYLGNHTTTSSVKFLSRVIAPRFQTRRAP